MDRYIPKKLRYMTTQEGYLLTLPHRDNTDGMFACQMIRSKL